MKVVSKNDYWLNEQQKASNNSGIIIQYAAVVQLTLQGEPIIQFLGSPLPSPKTYRRMKHYVPEIGDMVQIIDDTIIGGWGV